MALIIKLSYGLRNRYKPIVNKRRKDTNHSFFEWFLNKVVNAGSMLSKVNDVFFGGRRPLASTDNLNGNYLGLLSIEKKKKKLLEGPTLNRTLSTQ